MMKSVESVRLLVILVDVLGSILKGLVCRCLLLETLIRPQKILVYLSPEIKLYFLSFFLLSFLPFFLL